MTLQPKNRFFKTDDRAVLANIVASEAFLNAITSALAQMQMNQPNPENPAKAWDSTCKMAGAKEFIQTLLNLAEPEKETPRLPDKNLKHI